MGGKRNIRLQVLKCFYLVYVASMLVDPFYQQFQFALESLQIVESSVRTILLTLNVGKLKHNFFLPGEAFIVLMAPEPFPVEFVDKKSENVKFIMSVKQSERADVIISAKMD